ncbi:SDR family NAD(P)-dependent oxidoreductase [Gracilimonas sp. Q87]|uniref:SDR family NAD(P)-dependent oxidoreductase n=1 Tax=Gracilimonas sp. Q87 TaxID=3384766 RepID=UPI0039841CAA
MGVLQDKVAIVTGGAKGIGESTALLFAKEGAKVVVSDIDEENGKNVVEAIKENGGEAIFLKSDASKAEDHEELVKKTVGTYGKLDIAINNAGIGGPLSKTAEYPIDGWNNVINLNLNGVFYGTRYQIAEMLKNGGGSIVNIASILGQVGTANSPAYVAAKHGVVGLTKTAAIEYAKEGIRVNSVGPGYIKTPLLNALDDDTLEMLKGMHPIGRLGKPEEVAEIILWLASDKASFVTGNYYAVDGGYLSQ